MTDAEVREAALRLVERTTAAHGVPRYVEDDRVLRRVAGMLAERGEAPAANRRGPALPNPTTQKKSAATGSNRD